MIKLKIADKIFDLNGIDMPLPEDEVVVLDVKATAEKYPLSNWYPHSPNNFEVALCSRFNGDWEDQDMRKVVIVGWLPIHIQE